MPADEADATLALAVADSEYLELTIEPHPGFLLNLRNAEISFTIRRIDWHAPRRYAVMTGIDGFANGSQVFASNHANDIGTNLEFAFRLPDTSRYSGINQPVELRIYGYSGQYSGHKSSLTAFKLKGQMSSTCIGDHDGDFDVDGEDLIIQIEIDRDISTAEFAGQFGGTECN